MNINLTTVAFGAVILGGLVLFATGTPADRGAAEQARRAADVQPMPAYSVALAKQIAAYAAAVGPNAPKAETEVNGVKLRSVGFEIPTTGQAFPPGPNLEVMSGNCQSCHTPGMILTQPKLTAAEWTGEVTKMINVYKAPVDAADVPAIVAYLAALKVGP